MAEVCLYRAIVYPILLAEFQYLRIDKEEAVILETFLARVVNSNCIYDESSYLVGHEAVSSLPMGRFASRKALGESDDSLLSRQSIFCEYCRRGRPEQARPSRKWWNLVGLACAMCADRPAIISWKRLVESSDGV